MPTSKLFATVILLIAFTNSYCQNVGVGTTSPTEKLHVDSGHIKIGKAVLSSGQSNLLKFGDGDFVTIGEDQADDKMSLTASYFIIKSNGGFGGKVGINTNPTLVPGAQLEVNGNVKITDGLQANGKVLTSDNTGLAAWQLPAYVNSGFKGVISASAQNISSGTNTTIIYTAEDYDDASSFFSTTFNVPANGLYHFDVMTNWDITAVASSSQYSMVLTVNGSDVHGTVMRIGGGQSGAFTQEFSCDIKLTAGQTVSVYLNQNSGILQAIKGTTGSTRYTYFSGRRVY